MFAELEKRIVIHLDPEEDFRKFSYIISQTGDYKSDPNCPMFDVKIFNSPSPYNWDIKITTHLSKYKGDIYFAVSHISKQNGEWSADWDIATYCGWKNMKKEFVAYLKKLVFEYYEENINGNSLGNT